MATETIDTKSLLSQIHVAIAEMARLMSALAENKVNAVPYENSWTPGQVLRHVSKSIDAMAKALHAPGEMAQKDRADRVEELKKRFLDFSHKMKSPAFIEPEAGPYDRHAIISELLSAEQRLDAAADDAGLSDVVNGLPLGPITKREIIHFTLYHTQRHLHQMKKITEALR